MTKKITIAISLMLLMGTAQAEIPKNIQRQIIDYQIEREAYRQDVDPALIKAIILHESGFNKRAKSNAGAYGLMQVRFSTWKPKQHCNLKHASDLYWPSTNLKCGIYVFKKYSKLSGGNLRRTLKFYNAGPYNKSKTAGLAYAEKVLLTYAHRSF